jgi:putative transposase
VKSQVLEFVGLSRSSFYFRKTGEDLREHNPGRKPPGFTTNRDGTIILDVTISNLIRDYRNQPEYANAAGVRKLKHLLRRDHRFYVNEKKIYRICLENSYILSRRGKKGIAKRRIAINRTVTKVNQVWQFDMKYGYVDGERKFFFVLAFIDVFTRKVVGEHIGLSCKSGDLCFALRQSLEHEGISDDHQLVIRSDNGPQMTSRELSQYLSKLEKKLTHEFIPVQTPNKNAHIESFFSILEVEFLCLTYFTTFAEAYEKTKSFIRFYNEVRIHGSLGYITPAEAMDKLKRGELLNIKAINM